MTNYVVKHRRSETIYDGIDEAKDSFSGITDATDGEIAIARYTAEDGSVKSVMGVCNKVDGEEECTWTTFSYDDLLQKMPNFWKGTLTEYVAIKDKDPDCIYFIVDNNINTAD